MTDKVQEAEKVWRETNLAMDDAFRRGDAAQFSKCRTENVKAVHALLAAIQEKDEHIEQLRKVAEAAQKSANATNNYYLQYRVWRNEQACSDTNSALLDALASLPHKEGEGGGADSSPTPQRAGE